MKAIPKPSKTYYETDTTDNSPGLLKQRKTVEPQKKQGILEQRFYSAAEKILEKTYELDRIADAIDELHLGNKKVAIGGNIASVTGCGVGLVGLGMSLIPFTAAVSAPVFFAGGVVCVAGKITNSISTMRKHMKNKSYAKIVKDILEEIKNVKKNMYDITCEFQITHSVDIMTCMHAFSLAASSISLRKKILNLKSDAVKSENMAKLTKPENKCSLESISNKDKLIIGATLLFEMAFDLGQIMKDYNDICEDCTTEQAKKIHEIANEIRHHISL